MEPAMQPRQATAEVNGLALVSTPRAKISDRVVDFAASARDTMQQAAAEGGKRDFSSALDLVSEAFEAIRLADERAAASVEYQNELIQHHADQVKVLEMRILAAEKRADAAETRAKTAEGWLAKFHDTIMDEFQRTFASRQT